MPITVATALGQCYEIYNSLNPTKALEYLQVAQDKLAVELPLNLVETDLQPTANSRTIALNVADKRLWHAYWMTSSSESDMRWLRPTSVNWLDANRPNWRRRAPATPVYRYMGLSGETLVLGMDPMPNEGTGSGYPKVRVYTSRTSTLTTDGNLPATMLSYEAHVFYACRLHAIANQQPDRIETMTAFYEKALLDEKAASAAAGFGDAEDPPSIAPNWMRVGGFR